MVPDPGNRVDEEAPSRFYKPVFWLDGTRGVHHTSYHAPSRTAWQSGKGDGGAFKVKRSILRGINGDVFLE